MAINDTQYIISPYMANLLVPTQLRKIITRAIRKLPNIRFDSIAFRGMSGAIIAPFIAAKLNKQLIMVRKNDNSAHSICRVEGYSKVKRYIIVDDFVETGKTAATIYFEIKDFAPSAECLGILAVADSFIGERAEFIKLEKLKNNYLHQWQECSKAKVKEVDKKKVKNKSLRKSKRKTTSKI